MAAGGEEGVDGVGLLGVAVVGAALEAGGEALFQFGVNAAGVAGIGLEVFLTAAEEEEVEHGLEPSARRASGRGRGRRGRWRR